MLKFFNKKIMVLFVKRIRKLGVWVINSRAYRIVRPFISYAIGTLIITLMHTSANSLIERPEINTQASSSISEENLVTQNILNTIISSKVRSSFGWPLSFIETEEILRKLNNYEVLASEIIKDLEHDLSGDQLIAFKKIDYDVIVKKVRQELALEYLIRKHTEFMDMPREESKIKEKLAIKSSTEAELDNLNLVKPENDSKESNNQDPIPLVRKPLWNLSMPELYRLKGEYFKYAEEQEKNLEINDPRPKPLHLMSLMELCEMNDEYFRLKNETQKGDKKQQAKSNIGTLSFDKKSDERKVDETKVDETKVDETKVDETKVDETKVDETKVDETKPKEQRIDLWGTELIKNPVKIELALNKIPTGWKVELVDTKSQSQLTKTTYIYKLADLSAQVPLDLTLDSSLEISSASKNLDLQNYLFTPNQRKTSYQKPPSAAQTKQEINNLLKKDLKKERIREYRKRLERFLLIIQNIL